MKTIAIRQKPTVRCPAYPNAADRSYFWGKILDGALAVATAIGAFVVILFLLFL